MKDCEMKTKEIEVPYCNWYMKKIEDVEYSEEAECAKYRMYCFNCEFRKRLWKRETK